MIAAPGPFWIDIALIKTVISWIGIDKTTDSPTFRRDLWLNATPRTAVSRDHYLSLDADAAAVEFLVVGGRSVVHVHERTANITVDGIGIVSRQLFLLLARSRVFFECRFVQLESKFLRCRHLDEAGLRRREQHLEFLDLRLEAKRLELVRNELCVFFIIGRSQIVRLGGETLHPVAQVVGVQI